MISPFSSSSPSIAKSCQCQTQLLSAHTLSRGPFRTGSGCHAKQKSSRVVLISAVQRNSPPATSSTTKSRSQPAEQSPSAPRLTSAASVNLMQVLAGSAITQGFRQLQSTVDQLQQAGNKLTKGFSPRPLGFPPGATLALPTTDHLCLLYKLVSHHRQQAMSSLTDNAKQLAAHWYAQH